MTDIKILFLTHLGSGYVGAPNTRHGFEQEVAKLCECKFAGEGWSDYVKGESMDETVKRVMPDADWVIDRDNNLHEKKPENRRYKVGHFMSDLHGKHHYGITSPVEYAELINKAEYDAVFMRYPLLYGARYQPKVVHDWIKCEKHWVPWSVDDKWYHPKPKKIDVAFIGTTGPCYPLRNMIWENLYYVARGHKVLREQAPRGKTYERVVKTLKDTHLVGERYRDALAETRILLFGCSIYRYVLQKFFVAPASQCMVMSNEPAMAKRLGFVDGKTYVEVDEGNWEELLLHYLENPDAVRQIARNGMKNVLMNHNHRVRAEQWLEMIT